MGSMMLAMMIVVGSGGQHQASYFEEKAAHVFASFLGFGAVRTVEEDQNRVQQARDRDALLWGGRAPSMQSGAMGSMIMGAAVVLAAHAPAKMRAVVDGPVHVGPALFEGGGMGASVAARFE